MKINNVDKQYLDLCKGLLQCGKRKKNRTGVDTIGLFGAQMSFDLQEGFPILTTKKVFWKGVVHELLWFLSGSTNIKYLVDNGVNIWNKDAYRYAKKNIKEKSFADLSEEDFIKALKQGSIPAHFSDLGYGTYGSMWRGFPGMHDSDTAFIEPVDQIIKLINTLQTNPDDRRMLVTAWHPYWSLQCALPPCHLLFQCHTEELEVEERMKLYNPDQHRIFIEQKDVQNWTDIFDRAGIPKRRLNLQMYQRSCDMFLGVPFNISSYALLTHLIAHCVNMVPGTFIHTLGDYHIYENHLDAIKEQLKRDYTGELPELHISKSIKDIFAIQYRDIELRDYNPQDAIKGEVCTDDVTPMAGKKEMI